MSSEDYTDRIRLYIGSINFNLLQIDPVFSQMKTNEYFDLQHDLREFLNALPKIEKKWTLSRRTLLNRKSHSLLDKTAILKLNLSTNKIAFDFLKGLGWFNI